MKLLAILSLFSVFINTQIVLDTNISKERSIQPKIKSGTEAEAKKFLHYAFAAYCNNEDLRSWKCRPYCKGNPSKMIVTPVSNSFLNVTGFVAIDDTENQIIISFRGSKNTQNWILNFNAQLAPIIVDKKVLSVHTGFWLDLNSLYYQVKKALLDAKVKRPNYKILFTGHSLGGALISLLILRLRQDGLANWDEFKLITYAAPRIGDVSVMDYFNSKDIISLRVLNPMDIVPNMGPDPLYRHFEFPLLSDPLSTTGPNCGVEVVIDPVKCLVLNDKLDANHKTFWGEYYPSQCS